MWSPLTPRCLPSLRARGSGSAGRERISSGELPIAPAERISTLHSTWNVVAGRQPRRVRAVVVDLARRDDVAVGARRARAISSACGVRPDLDAELLGGREVVRDDRVLGGEDAARVTPLRLDAAVQVDRDRNAVAAVAGASSVLAHSPPDFGDLLPGRALHAQRRLGARVVRSSVARLIWLGQTRRRARRPGAGRGARMSRVGARSEAAR